MSRELRLFVFGVVSFFLILVFRGCGVPQAIDLPQASEKPSRDKTPCPITVDSGALELNSVDTPIIKMDLRNNSKAKVIAFELAISGSNLLGDEIKPIGSTSPVMLLPVQKSIDPESTVEIEERLSRMREAREVKCAVVRIKFEDGSGWDGFGAAGILKVKN